MRNCGGNEKKEKKNKKGTMGLEKCGYKNGPWKVWYKAQLWLHVMPT
jgi:hypothetical protein